MQRTPASLKAIALPILIVAGSSATNRTMVGLAEASVTGNARAVRESVR